MQPACGIDPHAVSRPRLTKPSPRAQLVRGNETFFPIASPAGNGMQNGMSITITLGKAGRLVVPKAIRESLGLREGSRLIPEVHGGKLQAAPEPDPVQIDLKDGFLVIRGGPALKRGRVVEAIKADRP